jgi:hypothetical protein
MYAGHFAAALRCGNCDSMLTGPYCAQCGQHAHASARNLAAVFHDGWHDITHLDGRLWHTLWLLLGRPGRLTADYFQERRARYLPPVRLYLVLSLVFFSLGLARDLPESAVAGTQAAEVTGNIGISGSTINLNTALPCERIQLGGLAGLERAARAACLRSRADRGSAFIRTMARNIPRMMFVFLPLMAGVMALLYWRPRRYYVEHLVFLLHNHSALFLCFVLLKLTDLLAGAWPALSPWDRGLAGVTLLYVLWYPYAAMRRYYAQGRALTLLKYAAIALAYTISLLFTLVGTALITVLES